MYGYIYLTTNLINERKYIGQHKSPSFDKSYLGSGTLIRNAIIKYGKENFNVELLEECSNAEELNLREAYYIDLYECVTSKDYYNLIPGGYGQHDDSGDLISKSHKGRRAWNKDIPMSQEQKDRISKTKKSQHLTSWAKNLTKDEDERVAKFSHPCSDYVKECVSKAQKGRPSTLKGKPLSEQHKSKISESRKGIPVSEEHKAKLVKAFGEKVMCIETGIIYDSLKQASLAMGYKSRTSLVNHLKGKSDICKGYHWKLID